MADAARVAGVRILRHQEVRSVSRLDTDEWQLTTAKGDIVCEELVNAAGLHAREVSALVGHKLPAVPMERQYLVTDELPDIDKLDNELPVLRDVSAPLYARQEGRSLLLGLYDREPVFWSVEGTPAGFDQELLQPDL